MILLLIRKIHLDQGLIKLLNKTELHNYQLCAYIQLILVITRGIHALSGKKQSQHHRTQSLLTVLVPLSLLWLSKLSGSTR